MLDVKNDRFIQLNWKLTCDGWGLWINSEPRPKSYNATDCLVHRSCYVFFFGFLLWVLGNACNGAHNHTTISWPHFLRNAFFSHLVRHNCFSYYMKCFVTVAAVVVVVAADVRENYGYCCLKSGLHRLGHCVAGSPSLALLLLCSSLHPSIHSSQHVNVHT